MINEDLQRSLSKMCLHVLYVAYRKLNNFDIKSRDICSRALALARKLYVSKHGVPMRSW